MRIVCKDVTAETLYDVLHDTSYRKKWDTNMIDTYDIGRLTVNADVGYYSCQSPSTPQNTAETQFNEIHSRLKLLN